MNKDRAKQFMPFDALKGLQDELRKKENNLEVKEKIETKQTKKCNYFLKIVDNSSKIL